MKLKLSKGDKSFYSIDLEDDHYIEIIDGDADVPGANRIAIHKERDHALIIEQRDKPMYVNPQTETAIRLTFMQRSYQPLPKTEEKPS